MVFSKEWDKYFQKTTTASQWPWSDLVTKVMRNVPNKSSFNVLELGCGGGANIPFFLSLKANYFGIDGSKTTIDRLKKKFPKLKKQLASGDFTKEIPFNEKFDIIIDRGAITHNTTNAIKNCLELIDEKLVKGGKIIAVDLFSTRYFEFKNGIKSEDYYTRKGYKKGRFFGVGNVHFFDKKHIHELFRNFSILSLEQKSYSEEIPITKKIRASWILVAKKK